jgi:hypothetical protein
VTALLVAGFALAGLIIGPALRGLVVGRSSDAGNR